MSFKILSRLTSLSRIGSQTAASGSLGCGRSFKVQHDRQNLRFTVTTGSGAGKTEGRGGHTGVRRDRARWTDSYRRPADEHWSDWLVVSKNMCWFYSSIAVTQQFENWLPYKRDRLLPRDTFLRSYNSFRAKTICVYPPNNSAGIKSTSRSPFYWFPSVSHCLTCVAGELRPLNSRYFWMEFGCYSSLSTKLSWVIGVVKSAKTQTWSIWERMLKKMTFVKAKGTKTNTGIKYGMYLWRSGKGQSLHVYRCELCELCHIGHHRINSKTSGVRILKTMFYDEVCTLFWKSTGNQMKSSNQSSELELETVGD